MSEPGSSALTAGKITGCYGIKGWVKIHSYTEPQDNLFRLGGWQLRRRGALEPVEFDQWKRQGKGMVAHIAGVDDRNEAEAYRGLEILVAAASLPSLEEGDYYWHQLEGLEVWGREPETDAGRVLLGRVDHLIETGANDVLVVQACEGSIDDRERLIPYLLDEVVSDVDLAAGRMDVDWYLDE
ncbi:ribosome maturation factor RimM [Mangrovimicrobium sediminis]|uniref:Ribosome maturation factor RimM n=1 Tax=Mangrovimicrobium sediminis TaxID=2562682 RepID=A0A4Z0M9P1_9GAMM|nr:ribosome maturation factor RimM [Haliea sp. SAOS-164]TGD76108.1 ribosome maturation factor RimM [Haliea sp. SAOS-164]